MPILSRAPEARQKEGNGGFFRAPRRLGGPPLLGNTEKDVPDNFFLTSNMHKIHFRSGLHPGPPEDAFNIPQTPCSQMMR